jgi:hypothetical protein
MSLTKATYSMIEGAQINVLDYGADPTGVADSTSAINAALAYAGSIIIPDTPFSGYGYEVKGGATVYLPAGEYKTTVSLVIPRNVSIVGAGKYSTLIKSTASDYIVKSTDVVTVSGTYNKVGTTLRDFSVMGDRSLPNQVGFGLLRSYNNVFENLTASRCGSHGFLLLQCISNTFISVESIYNVGDGWRMGNGIDSWSNPVNNSLPSNANQIMYLHALQNDGAGIYLDLGTNGNVFYTCVCEYNYWSSPANTGYNVHSATNSNQPNTFYSLWTEGPCEAYVYVNHTGISIPINLDQWKHFPTGASGSVNRALIVNTGYVNLSYASGSANLYKTLNGSNSPFRILDKTTGIITLQNCSGANVTGIDFVDDSTGANTGFENNVFQYNYGTMYNKINSYQNAGALYNHAWYKDTQTQPYAAVSPFYNGFLMGDGTAQPAVIIRAGTGTPEGAVAAPVGSLYLRMDGGAGTSLYVKQTGTGNTGWDGK